MTAKERRKGSKLARSETVTIRLDTKMRYLAELASRYRDEAPRGLEFLYSTNRLNVAVSRAQALALVVGSPELAAVSCKTPRQMKLVNALCAYLEASAANANLSA